MRRPRPTTRARPRGAILALAPLVLALAGCSRSPGTVPTRATARGVVHDYAGRPLAGARVKAGGLPEVTSAADGSYQAGEVDIPYDLVVMVPGLVNGAPLVHLYQGLTRGDLVPRTFAFLADTRTATLSGTVAFRPGGVGAFPMSASGGSLKLSLGTPELRMYVFPDLATGSWTHAAQWTGPSSVNATLHALAWEEAAGVPVRYLGYGEQSTAAIRGFTTPP